MTSIKKDKLKVFSILAGIAFLLLAAAEAVRAVVKVFVPMLLAILTGGFNFANILSNLLTSASSLIFIALAIVAAIIIFVKKNSVASLIPVGLLTYVIFQQIFSFAVNLFTSIVVSLLPGAIYVDVAIRLLTLYIPMVGGLICALIFTVIICVAACTFLKKHRFVLMFIITAVFALGCIGEVISMFLVVFAFISSILGSVNIVSILDSIWNSFILPVITIGIHGGLVVATALAAVGMISKPAAKVNEIDEAANTAEAEEVVESEEAVETVDSAVAE